MDPISPGKLSLLLPSPFLERTEGLKFRKIQTDKINQDAKLHCNLKIEPFLFSPEKRKSPEVAPNF